MSAAGVPVLDFHAHFPVRGERDATREAYVARHGTEKWDRIMGWLAEDQRAWRRAWGFPDPEPAGDDEEMGDRWAGEVTRHQLLRIVFVTGGGNDRLARIVAKHPTSFTGFAHHDPFQPGAAAELERAVTGLGLRGYKLIAPLLSGSIADERLWPVWETAERLGIPVLVHFGPLRYQGIVAHLNMSPLTLQDVARAFPGVPFVIPHFGCGYPRELLHLAWVCGNIYVDTSGSNEWMRWMPYELTLESLFRKFLETVGPRRILFGTDSSWFPRGFAVRYLEEQLRTCRALGCTEDTVRAIFAGNAARLLGIAQDSDRPRDNG